MRDRAGDITRATELLQSDANNGLDYAMAKQAEVQALSAHRLNLLAAIFFPIATFAGVFGMNLSHGLESRWAPWLLWIVVASGVAVGFVVKKAIGRPTRS